MIIGFSEIIIKLLLALFIGGLTGLEREKSHQFAGFRTHILVSVGSCITSITALSLFNQYHDYANIDPARLPAQVLSGIGFLGAGAILKTSNGIKGLTTAAGIWATACIGITIGYGQYILGVSAWIFVMSTLYILKRIDKIFFKNRETILSITINNIEALPEVYNKLAKSQIIIKNMDMESGGNNIWNIRFFVIYDRRLMLSEFSSELKKINYVMFIDFL
ncbi:MgtC/SapB family protein [Romboutsia ilealis]|uniref:MgtC/SapB family protein n=1 Tax=Romboutsia faecis TaxID=2764597 RepID=A0ABR7JQ18_9FIRM|nr:MgtC/SapB family protein [Romboutsia faecis]MRN25243.1 MgtC/SapB family protein [Romboutsia ilealis]